MRTKSIATALALGFLAYLLPVMTAQAGCVWRGNAPFCDGSCDAGEIEKKRSDGDSSEYPFGRACVTGTKALCCTAEPTQPPAANAQPETDPEFASFCNRYADDAVSAAKKNTDMKCGLEKENPD